MSYKRTTHVLTINVIRQLQRGEGGGEWGGRNKVWDRETMFALLAKKQSAKERFYERVGKFSAVISPVSGARVQR